MANLDRQQLLQPQKVPHTSNHQLSLPKLRLKSSSKLRNEQSTSPSPPRQPISSTSRRDSTTLQPRKSNLPKPMSAINSPMLTPVTTLKPRTSPPTKSHPVFGASLSPEKRPRNVIRRKPSSTSSSFSLVSLRTGSTNSFNASTASLTTSQSSVAGGSRNASQSSILGIQMPPTSSSRIYQKKRTGSSSSNEIPRIQTRDIPLSPPPSIGDSCPGSSPSTRYTDSPGPFSYSSAASSASSHSPGFAPVGYRSRQNPTPIARGNLDSVRESTTSTSSGSTIRAPRDKDGEDQDEELVGGWTGSPIPLSSPPIPDDVNYFSQHYSSTSAPTTPFYHYSTHKSPKIPPVSSPSPLLLSAPSPAPSMSRRKISVSSSASFSRLGNHTPDPSNNSAPRGLGVSIPTAASLAKGRSKSLSGSTAFSLPQRPTRTQTVTPPIPSPSFPPPRKNSAPIARGATPAPRDPMAIQAGLGSRVMSSRGDSKERAIPVSGNKERSPTRTSPGKPSRPGFFSRGRTRTNESLEEKERVKEKERESREKRKGPAAGTGHEAYAAFGRGRSGSTTSGSVDRSGSASSTATGSWGKSSRRGSDAKEPTDEYLRDRLKPVVIAGGGVIENYNLAGAGEPMMRTGSEDSTKEKRSFEFGKRAPTPVVMSREGSSEGSIFGRRKVSTPNPPPSPGSVDAPVQTKTKRWNFLRGTQTSSQRNATPAPPITPAPVAAVSTKLQVHTVRPPAHYAILDPEQRREAAQLAEQMQEMRQRQTSSNYSGTLRQQHHIHSAKLSNASSILLPPAPASPARVPVTAKPQAPVPVTAPVPVPAPVPVSAGEQAKQEVRQAKANERKRLQQRQVFPQVGRIPAPRYHSRKLSQPTNEPKPAPPPIITPAKAQMKLLPPLNTHYVRGDVHNTDMLTAPPTMGRPFEEGFKRANEQNSNGFQINWNGDGLTRTPTTAKPILGRRPFEFDPLDSTPLQTNELLTPIDDTPVTSTTTVPWPIRKDSVATPTLAPDVVVDEEEDIWNEYDDLLYDVDLFGEPENLEIEFQKRASARSTTSSLGSPFQYADLCSTFPDLLDQDNEETLATPQADESVEKGVYLHDSPTLSPALPTVIVAAPSPIMIGEPFQPTTYPLLSPSTPFSVSSFIRSYGDRDSLGSIAALPNTNLPPTSSPPALPGPPMTFGAPPKPRVKTHKPKGSNGSSGSNLSASSRGSDNFVDNSEDEMKVRLWALMTNRYLSFDRVLVSPAHEKMESITAAVGPRASGGGRILVVDGLGTDDWSFYCAFSYPRAKVYNLSPSLSANPNGTPPSPSTPRPPNHQQIHHPNFSGGFPFPGGFFNVISFRFLPSSSDSELPFILSECKRVLEPGGYLEVTMLDAELLNMGPKTKKAVNLVKAIMERESSSPSSSDRKPSSERVLRILQKRGFEDINKCFVGLPTVAPTKDVATTTTSTTPTPTQPQPQLQVEQEPETVNETVMSSVGRWWYTRCYERVITAEGEVMRRSMWNDRTLLRECGTRGTAFKMLVAHARKPLKTPAAIVSEGGVV